MFGGFQSNAFQNNAFQIISGAVAPDNGWLGGGGYVAPYHKYKEEEYQREKIRRKEQELKRVEEEIAEFERRRLENLAQARATKKAEKLKAALEAQLQEEINLLRIKRIELMRYIDEEEAILILLMTARHRLRVV